MREKPIFYLVIFHLQVRRIPRLIGMKRNSSTTRRSRYDLRVFTQDLAYNEFGYYGHPTIRNIFYRPQMKFAEVMFSQGSGVSVQGISVQGGLYPGMISVQERVSVKKTPIPIRLLAGSTYPTGMHSCFLSVGF